MNDCVLRLSELAESKASGDLVCEDGGGEIHLFLSEGQITWATDSRHPAIFNRHLKENAKVDDDSMAAVVTECRQSKASLCDTLIAWKLATSEQVRAALRQQIGAAITSVKHSSPAAKTVFLSRCDRSRGSAQLAFAVGQFLGDTPAAAPRANPPSVGNLDSGPKPSSLPPRPNGKQEKPTTPSTPPPAQVEPAPRASGAASARVPRTEEKRAIAIAADLPQVKSAVRADLRGTLLDSVREANPESVAAVVGFLMSTMMKGGTDLGLGPLRKLTVTGEKTSSLVMVEGDSVLYVSVAPPAAITAAGKALDCGFRPCRSPVPAMAIAPG